MPDDHRTLFPLGSHVRYKPGYVNYPWVDSLEEDGRLLGTVVGHTPTRVRVRLQVRIAGRVNSRDAAVDVESLVKA